LTLWALLHVLLSIIEHLGPIVPLIDALGRGTGPLRGFHILPSWISCITFLALLGPRHFM